MSNGRPPPLDPPSGRWDRDDVTPTPVDTVALEERRRRLTIVEREMTGVTGRLAGVERRVEAIEQDAKRRDLEARTTTAELNSLHRDFAVISTKLEGIIAALKRIEDQRDVGGQRARNTVQLVLMLLAILASLVVGIVSIVTR